MPAENIKFEIAFKSNWWRDAPHASVWLDSYEKFNGLVKEDTVIKFSHELEFIPHRLRIVRSGKDNQQVRKTDQGYQGQELVIDWIKIDGVNIRNIIWTKSKFKPEYPEPWAGQMRAAGELLEESIVGETYLSHNGVWELNFKSPFYKFLIEQMG